MSIKYRVSSIRSMPIKKIKKSVARKTRSKKVSDQAKLQELRDVVERLPELTLPGAPKDLPKDLSDANPSREPALLPNTPLYSKGTKAGVWIAVLLTFTVIAGAWAATLKNVLSVPGATPQFGDNLAELKEEWKDAAENVKGVLEEMNARLKVASATSSREGEEALKAAAARVIFEAGMASGTATSTK